MASVCESERLAVVPVTASATFSRPRVFGLKQIVTGIDLPAGMITGGVTPLTVKSAVLTPVSITLVTFRSDEPGFLIESVRQFVLPTSAESFVGPKTESLPYGTP